jgi:hypothetical protein
MKFDISFLHYIIEFKTPHYHNSIQYNIHDHAEMKNLIINLRLAKKYDH